MNIGDFLNQFRDSEVFNIPIPFTGYDLGDAFDFSYGWTKVLNEKLQGILSFDLTSDEILSPRLSDDVAFDLVLERPGDLRASNYTVTLLKADTNAFTHIDQLAEYISGRIAEATFGALQLQSSLPTWVTENQQIDTTNTDTNANLSAAVTGTAATVSETQQGGQAVNAVLLLDLSTATGSLSLKYLNGTPVNVSIVASDSDAQIAGKLSQAVSGLISTAPANVIVTGNRGDGFRIEFGGNIGGRAYTAADFTMNMTVDAGATSSVTVTAEASGGASEVKVLGFSGYASGTFELQLLGQKTGPIRYISDPLVQAKMIQQALEAIAGAGNVSVTFPQKDPLDPAGTKTNFGSAPKFVITFKGALANRDIPNMTIYYGSLKNSTYVPAGETRGVSLVELVAGENGKGEVQTVSVNAASATNPASFRLQWAHDGKTYTTANLSSNASASQVRAALLAATASGGVTLGDIAGINLKVSSAAAGSWRITFDGALAGVNVGALQVTNLSNVTVATPALRTVQEAFFRSETQQVVLGASTGSFQIQLGRDGTLSASVAASATAKELQAVLEALPEIGKGNVRVSGEPQRWTIEFTGRLSGQDVLPLIFNPVQELAVSPRAIAAGETVTHVLELGFVGQTAKVTVDVAGMSTAQARVAIQAALERLDGVGVGNVAVRAGTLGADNQRVWEVVFKGELSGRTTQALQMKSTVSVTTGGVTNVQVANVTAKAVVASLIQVGSSEQRVMSGGLTWGKLSFKPVNVDDFTYFAIVPSAGVVVDSIQAGSAASGISEVQRIVVADAGVQSGKTSQYTLSLSVGGKTATTAPIAADAGAAAIQSAINAALTAATIDGSVSVALDNPDQPNVFMVTFGGGLANQALPLLQASFSGLRAVAGAEAVVYTLQDGRAATAESVARDEVQRLVFNNVAGGMYGLAMSVNGSVFPIQEPLQVLPSVAEMDAALTRAGMDAGTLAGLSEHAKRALLIERALQQALTTGPKGIAGAVVSVTAVPGGEAGAFAYDIVFSGTLGGANLPTLLVFGEGLQAPVSSQTYGNGSLALGFSADGREALTTIGPKFNTLEDFALVLQDAINQLLPAGETFSITARFDAVNQDFLFDLRLTPALPTLAVPLNLGFDALAPLASFTGSGLLALDAGIDFITTIGIDFNRPNDFTVQGGLVVKGEINGNLAAGIAPDFGGKLLKNPALAFDATTNPAVDGKFQITIDGRNYEVLISAGAQADNASLTDLIADINAALAAVAVPSGSGSLARLGYTHLGQFVQAAAVTVGGKIQIGFTVYGTSVQSVGIRSQPVTVDAAQVNTLQAQLGIGTISADLSAQREVLPASTVLGSGMAFDLVVNGADDLATGGRTATIADNRITVGVAAGTYTPQALADALNAAFAGINGDALGPLKGKVSNLGQALVAVVVTLPDGEKVLALETRGQHIASLEFRALDFDPFIRSLGFVANSLNKAGGVSLFIQDTLLGGKLVAGVQQFKGSAQLGFVNLSMDNMVAIIDAGVNVRLLDGPNGNPGGRVYLSELIDAATLNDTLLGMRGAITLAGGGEQALIAAPRGPVTGQLAEDVGVKVTLTDPNLNGGRPISLDVTLLASSTAGNTTVAQLANNLNNAIRDALQAWHNKNAGVLSAAQYNALRNNTFVAAGNLELYDLVSKTTQTISGGALKFLAPVGVAMSVEGRRLIGNYLSPVTFSDSNYTIGSQPMASLVIDGIRIDAGGLNLLPPGTDPRIEINLPIIDVWQGAVSLADAIDVRVLGADALLGFKNMSWTQIIQGLRMVSQLLSQLDSFAFLNQSIPIIDLSVNDIFDIAADLATAIELLGENPAAGVGQLQSVLAESFGLPIYDPSRPDVFGVRMEYDAVSKALAINIPYQVQLLDKTYPISVDLQTLGELIGGNTLAQIMGPVSSIVDVGGSALVRLQSTAMLNLALGIDLASGSMFVYDFYDAGTPDDFSDDLGTFARLGLNVNGTNLAFNASLGAFSLGVKGGTANINAQAGLFLMDEPSGAAGYGDGRHYLASAVSISTLQAGDAVTLVWKTAPAGSGYAISGQGSATTPWTIVASSDETFRLRITVAGQEYFTQSLSRDFDAVALKAYLEDALFFGSAALRGTVNVTQIDPANAAAGWKISLAGQGFDGKTLAVSAHQLRADADGGPLGTANAIQWVKVPSGSGGSFTLSLRLDGKTYKTADIAYNATAAQVASALQTALTSGPNALAGAQVIGTAYNAARPQDGWKLEFAGSLAARPIDLLEANTGGLVHVGAVAVVPVVVSSTPGMINVTRVSVVAGTSGSFDLSFTYQGTTRTASGLAHNIDAAGLQTALNAAMGGGYTGITVVDDRDYGGFRIEFGGTTLTGKAVTVTANTTNLKASPFGALMRDLEVVFDGTAEVKLPGYVTLPGEIVSLGKKAGVLASNFANPIYVGDIEVRINSLADFMGDLVAGRSASSSQIATSGVFDTSKTINYALPDLNGVFDLFALGNPLIRLIRDPSIIIDGIDYALKGIQKSLDTIASLPLPLIGDQLAKGAQFIGDFRGSVIAKIQQFVSTTIQDFGGMENALRMVLFDAFTQDSNNDGIINPVSWDKWIEYEIDGTAMAARSGDNPLLNFLKDYNADGIVTADDIVVEFLAMGMVGVTNGTRLGYTLAGRSNEEKGGTGMYGGQVVNVGSYNALNQAKALQFRMHLGQDLLERDVDLSFDIGLPGLNLTVDGGIGLNLGWDFFFGFGVNTQEGLYLVSKMPGHAGLDDAQYTERTIGGVTYAQDPQLNPLIANPWALPASGVSAAVKELSIKFEAMLSGSAADPTTVTANIFFLQGQLTDDWRTSVVDKNGVLIQNYDPFGGNQGARTFFRGEFAIDMTDANNDGRLTWGEMTRGKFSDNFKSSVTGAAQANFRMDLSIAGMKVLPRLVADFHLTWALNQASIPTGYGSTFATTPQVWITDLGIDVGSFFSDFLVPIVGEIQKVTKPLQPIIDGLMAPIPGISALAGRDFSILDMAEALGKGKVDTKFIKSFVYMLDLFNSIPVDAQGLIIPIGRVFSFGGDLRDPNSRKNATLDGNVNDASSALAGAPMADPKTGATGGSAAGTQGFLDKLKNPNNAFKIPLLTDFSLVLDLIMGKPVDLVTFTPPNLSVSARIDIGTVIYSFPTVKAGIRGGIDVNVALTLGFDTYGIMRFIDSGNPLHIFDGFYVSDNIRNGVDFPEITVDVFMALYAELNAVILRAGIEGGIKLRGTLDFWDEEGPGARDGKFRASEILNQLMCTPFNPLNLVEASLKSSLYAKVYVDLNTLLFGWKNVYSKTLFDITLFEVVWKPKPCVPILASDDNGDGTFVLHMGNKALLPANSAVDFDIAALITKDAADRKYKNTEDGDEKFVLKELGNGEVEITATLNGTEYTVVYTGVKRIVGFTGKGKDVIDASGLKSIEVVLVAGEGDNTLIGSAKDDVLIGGTGKTTLKGGAGADLLIARAGTTTLEGGAGADSYRFIGNWGQASIDDRNPGGDGNVFDFSRQSAGLLFDTVNGVVTQGTSRATWTASTEVALIAGGTGNDTIDMSFESARLHVLVADIAEDMATIRAGLQQDARTRLVDTDDAKLNDGVITGATSGRANGQNAPASGYGDRYFLFSGIENLIGGVQSDVFVFQNQAAITGSLYGGSAPGVGLNTSVERAGVRNTLDFSDYNAGVRINTSAVALTLPDGFATVAGDTVVPMASRINANAQNVTIRGFHNIFGGRGNDVIVGDLRQNMLFGMDGDDTLISVGGGDLLVADSIRIDGADKEVRKVSANYPAWTQLPSREWMWHGQEVQNFAMGDTQGMQVLIGGGGDDVLMGSTGGDRFHTRGGNDVVVGDFARLRFDTDGRIEAGTVDTLWRDFGGGDDVIVGLDGDHVVIGGHGADTITLGNGCNLVLGDVGSFEIDSITHRVRWVETLASGEGAADTITLGSGSNIVLGGAGGDTITASDLADSFNIVLGDHGRIEFSLTEEDDHRLSRIESQVNVATGGNDTISLQSGNAIVMGGRGDDQITASAAASTASNYRYAAGDHVTMEFDVMGRLERMFSTDTAGSGGADQIRLGATRTDGLNGENIVFGGLASDIIELNGSTNVVLGDLGWLHLNSVTRRTIEAYTYDTGEGAADQITTGRGNSLIFGGAGGDTITVVDDPENLNIVLGDHGRVLYSLSEIGDHRLSRIESQVNVATGGNDTISLQSGNAIVLGGRGADTITISAVLSTAANYRYVAGDHATLVFDVWGGLVRMSSTDTVDATGGDDIIRIGAGRDSGHVGMNFVIGGMGSDQMFIAGASRNPANGVVSAGTARSEDVLIGDNGEILRAAATAMGGPNHMLQVRSLVNDKGGNDIIAGGDGGKVIIGGYANDTIVARDGDHLVIGDAGQFDYDTAAQNGILRRMQANDLVLGGNDSITLREGYKVVMGGFGADTIDIRATGLALATGPILVTGIASVSAVGPTEARGRSGRYVVGDNATIQFDSVGGLYEILSTDAIAATGGADHITLGAQGTTADLGYQVVVGGMDADTILVREGARSEDVLIGDNVLYERRALGYGVLSIASMNADKGGDDSITTGRGVKTVIGGAGADTLRLNTAFEAGKVDRSLVLGDSGTLTYDIGGSGSLTRVESTSIGFGGNDSLVVGDGDLVFVGGYGRDTLTVNSTRADFRVAVGDNALLQFGGPGMAGDLIFLQTLDQGTVSGDNDVFLIGQNGDVTSDMGRAILIGGMGGDTIRVAGARASVVMAGDNVELTRNRVSGHIVSLNSLAVGQGAGDILQTTNGEYLIVGGLGGDTISAGKGYGVVLGDSGSVQFAAPATPGLLGQLQAVASLGLSQGGADVISLGAGTAEVDGDKVVIGGVGDDRIEILALAGHERFIAADNADIRFDVHGRMTSFATLDVSQATAGNDSVSLAIAGETPAFVGDVNVLAGGLGNDEIAIFAAGPTRDVLAGDNLDYRRGRDALGQYQDLFVDVPQPLFGGNDIIVTGVGDKIILGGAGDDALEARGTQGDRVMMFGDAGTVVFDVALSGAPVRAFSTGESSGGNDRLTIGGGDAYLFAGRGNDVLSTTGLGEERVFFGDNGQIDWALDGAISLIQSTGSDHLDPTTTSDTFNLLVGGRNYVIGGPGVDVLNGALTPVGEGVDAGEVDVALPGSGSIRFPGTPGQIVSVVTLGSHGEFGAAWAAYAQPDPDGGGGDGGEGEPGGDGIEPSLVGYGDLTEGEAGTVTGKLSYPALDGGNASFVAGSQEGAYGTLTLGGDGLWQYAADAERVAALKTGDERIETFLVRTSDGSVTVITITIHGRDIPAVICGVQSGRVVEDQLLDVAGQLTIVDPDTGEAGFRPWQTAGLYGQFAIAGNGAWQYTLDNGLTAVQALAEGQEVEDRFVIRSIDGTEAEIVVVVEGRNDAAVIGGVLTGVLTAGAGNSLEGQLTASDVDNTDDLFQSVADQVSEGGYGRFELTADGRWLYRLDESHSDIAALLAGQQVIDSFTVRSEDGTQQQVQITIQGSALPEPDTGGGTPLPPIDGGVMPPSGGGGMAGSPAQPGSSSFSSDAGGAATDGDEEEIGQDAPVVSDQTMGSTLFFSTGGNSIPVQGAGSGTSAPSDMLAPPSGASESIYEDIAASGDEDAGGTEQSDADSESAAGEGDAQPSGEGSGEVPASAEASEAPAGQEEAVDDGQPQPQRRGPNVPNAEPQSQSGAFLQELGLAGAAAMTAARSRIRWDMKPGKPSGEADNRRKRSVSET